MNNQFINRPFKTLLVLSIITMIATSSFAEDKASQIKRLRHKLKFDSSRKAAANELVRLGPEGITAIVKSVESTDNHKLYFDLIPILANAGSSGISAFRGLINHDDIKVATQTASVLRFVYYPGPLNSRPLNVSSFEILFEAANHSKPQVRAAGIKSLGSVLFMYIRMQTKMKFNPFNRLSAADLEELIKKAVPLFIKASDSSEEKIRYAAVSALGYMSYNNSDALAALFQLLRRDPDLSNITFAMKKAGEKAIPGLIDALKDENPKVCNSAAAALGEIGAPAVKHVPAIIAELKNKPLSQKMLNSLGKLGPSTMPIYEKAIRSNDEEVRGDAIEGLEEMGIAAVPLLIEALKDRSIYLRRDAAGSIYSIFHYGTNAKLPVSKEAVPALAELLYDDYACSAAVRTLVDGDSAAAPYLIKALRDPNLKIRSNVLESIKNAAHNTTLGLTYGDASFPEEIIPEIVNALNSEDSDYRENARLILKALRKRAAPGLILTLRQDNSTVRTRAMEIIKDENLVSASEIDLFLSVLNDPDLTVRMFAADIIGSMGAYAEKGVPALLAALEDEELMMRIAAVNALGKIGSAAVRPLITKLSNPSLQAYAVDALIKIGPDAVIPLLAEIQQENKKTQNVAHYILTQMDPEIARLLTKELKDKNADPKYRRRLVVILGELKQSPILPLETLADEDICVQLLAINLITKHGSSCIKEFLDEEPGELKKPEDPSVPTQKSSSFIKGLLFLMGKSIRNKPLKQSSKVDNTPVQTAVKHLILALDDRALDILAIEAIGRLGPEARDAIPKLVLLLENERLAQHAANALGQIGPSAVDALLKALKSPDPNVRDAAIYALGKAGIENESDVLILVDILKTGDATSQVLAIDALGETGSVAADALIKLLGDSNPKVRCMAALILSRMKSYAYLAVPALIATLDDENEEVSSMAIVALGQIGPTAINAIPNLKSALDDAVGMKRMNIGWSFWQINQHAWGPELLAQTVEYGDDSAVRLISAIRLGQVGPKASFAVDALIKAINDPKQEVRAAAVMALANIGPKAKSAMTALKKSAEQLVGQARVNLGWALWQIGQHAWGPDILAQTLTDQDVSIRLQSATALAQIGEHAYVAVPKLTAAIDDKDEQVRNAAVLALAQIGPAAKAAIPTIENLHKTARGEARLYSAFALWSIANRESSISILEQALTKGGQLGLTSAGLLAEIGPPAKSSVSALTRSLGDAVPEIRQISAIALAQIGEPSDSAVVGLLTALKDEHESVRNAAASALLALHEDFTDLIPPMAKAFEDEQPGTCWRAARAIVWQPEPSETPLTVGQMTNLLKSNKVKQRCIACLLLAASGPEKVRSTVENLKDLKRKDKNEHVRYSAIWALKVINL
jgi:HEAT repeat protein